MKRLFFLGLMAFLVIEFHHPMFVVEHMILYASCVLFLLHFKKFMQEE